mgnify:CR=1 FL=1
MLDVCTLASNTDALYWVGIFAFSGVTEEQASITHAGNDLE